MAKRRKLVHVEWEDSAFTPGWRSHDHNLPGTSPCESVGFLLEKSKSRVILAMQVNGDGGYGEAMAIPRSVVKKIREL